jgi:hypothetical protein
MGTCDMAFINTPVDYICIDINADQALARGVGADTLGAPASFRDSLLFTAREQVALEFAERVTRTDEQLDETLIARRREHFCDDALDFLNALFHGLDFRRIEVSASEYRVGTFVTPLIVLVVWGFLMGTFGSWLYQYLGTNGSVGRSPKDAK